MKAQQDFSVEEKLKMLYKLQLIDSEIDKINILLGELPLEVEDLSDEIQGLETRIEKYTEQIENDHEAIKAQNLKKEESKSLIDRYTKQLDQVRNNREYDSLQKEIEFQTLEIELAEKKIREAKARIEENTKLVEETQNRLEDKKKELEEKKKELEEIQKETEKEIKELEAQSKKISEQIEPRLLSAYKRIRLNVRNKLAVVRVQRDACGGCFNKVPPQRQVDIRSRKKIIVCEHCGRILIDKVLAYEVYDELGGKFVEIKNKEMEEEKELEKQKKPARRSSRARAKK